VLPDDVLRLKTGRGRWVLLATILGSGMASLDATVVNIALPRIGADLGGGLTTLQWIVNAYALTLGGFLLFGGSLGDRFGRRRVFVIGVSWFAIASVGCAVAPTAGLLISARALEGVGAALLTPGSLAILQASFQEDDRAGAIGAWAAFAGIATAIGPVIGGTIIQSVSWRLIFLINVPLAIATVAIAHRHVPETRDPAAPVRLDFLGSILVAVGLAGVVFALTEGPNSGWTTQGVLASGVVGIAAIVGFVLRETSTSSPILPLTMFRSAQFSAANGVTFLVYGGLGGALFLLPVYLQRVLAYSPTDAGLSLLPLTLVTLALSSRIGKLATRIGPRIPMTVGPVLGAIGFALLSQVHDGSAYIANILPGMTFLAFGLAFTVAPLTATVLAAVSERHSGVASAINTDVARIAQLVAVAVLPLVAGITDAAYSDNKLLTLGFQHAMWITSAALALGGILSATTVRRPLVDRTAEVAMSCPITGPPSVGPGATAIAAEKASTTQSLG
jgi:EmrB/QacA subfamily drug resistance transporter